MIENIRAWPKGKQIAFFVCSLHLFALFTLLIHHWMHRQIRVPKAMIVRTIIPQMAAPIAVAQVEKPIAKKEAPKKEVASKVMAAPAKTVVKAKATPLPAAKKLPVPKDDSLLKEIAGHLEAFQEAQTAPKKELPIPAKVEPRAITPTALPTYGGFLVGYLQEALELPEHGDVKIKLEIDRFGRLISCEILDAKSVKNAEFLKNRLPELTFPCLNDFDILETAQTFTITFRNVETR